MQDGELYDWGPPADVVTEGLLADVFGVDAPVREGLDGPEIVPRRPLESADGRRLSRPSARSLFGQQGINKSGEPVDQSLG